MRLLKVFFFLFCFIILLVDTARVYLDNSNYNHLKRRNYSEILIYKGEIVVNKGSTSIYLCLSPCYVLTNMCPCVAWIMNFLFTPMMMHVAHSLDEQIKKCTSLVT
jgi:hypothetical protein